MGLHYLSSVEVERHFKYGEIEYLSLQIEHNNNDKEKDRIDWRRSKVQGLSSQGYSQREIAQILQVSNGTVNRDLLVLRQQAKSNIKRYIDERLPEEYEKCLVGLTVITKEAWNTAQQAEDKLSSSRKITCVNY